MAERHLYATKITDTTADQREEMGSVREEVDRVGSNGIKKYRYVRFYAGTAGNGALFGDVCLYVGTTAFAVTRDVSDTSVYRVAGIATTAVANDRYCWLQTGGISTRVLTDGNAAAGTPLVPTTTDGIVGSMAVGFTGNQLGFALAADSGTVLANAILTCP